MPRRTSGLVASPPPQKIQPSRPLDPPLLLRTDFDYYSAWIAACQRDDLEGEKEAEENPDDLHSEPDEPDDLADFDDPASDGEDKSSDITDLPSPLTTPPSSPLLLPTSSSSTPSPNLTAFSNVITPMPHALSDLASNSTPTLSSLLSSSTNTLQPSDGFRTKKKRGRSAAAIAKNKVRKDEKKRAATSERRREQRLPVHGDAYVRRYLKADTVCRDFDVLDLQAVRGGDTGKVGRKCEAEDVPATVESAVAAGNDRFDWNGMCVTFNFLLCGKFSQYFVT